MARWKVSAFRASHLNGSWFQDTKQSLKRVFFPSWLLNNFDENKLDFHKQGVFASIAVVHFEVVVFFRSANQIR